jgi:hypothetical protein
VAHPEIEEWLNTAEGVALDPDGAYGNQCVDLVDAYGQAIFGVPWNVCVGGVVGAKQLLDAAPDEYWIRIDNDPSNPNLIPQRGDVVVTSGDALNQWGHTYGVLGADTGGVDAIQQDGFAEPRKFVNGGWYSNKPAHKARMPYAAAGMGYTLGWLRPRENKIVDTGAAKRLGLTTAGSQLLGYQRTTVKDSTVGYRSAPATSGDLQKWLDPDTTYDFKGFVRRQAVNGNDVWFVGRYTDGFAWSGGFTDSGTHDLPDLTDALFPKAVSVTNVRVTGADGVNRRKAPDKNATLIDTFGAGLEITLGGYVIGTDPYGKGNKVWFVGGISGGYMHSSGFTSQDITGLPLLPTPADVSPAAPAAAYDFVPDFDWVRKVPAALSNLEKGRAPGKGNPTVIHQMGTPGRDTLGSTINEFKRDGAFKSTHFGVEGSDCVQMVSLKDRAYHAGAVGNGYVGIETDPYQTAETIATVKRLLGGLKGLGYSTVYIRHKDVEGNNTSCGTLIDLSKYVLTDPVIPAPPVPSSPIVVPPAPADAPVVSEGDPLEKFAKWIGDDLLNRFRKENK